MLMPAHHQPQQHLAPLDKFAHGKARATDPFSRDLLQSLTPTQWQDDVGLETYTLAGSPHHHHADSHQQASLPVQHISSHADQKGRAPALSDSSPALLNTDSSLSPVDAMTEFTDSDLAGAGAPKVHEGRKTVSSQQIRELVESALATGRSVRLAKDEGMDELFPDSKVRIDVWTRSQPAVPLGDDVVSRAWEVNDLEGGGALYIDADG